MKNALPATLQMLAGLLEKIRQRPGLTEKKTGVFYKRGRAFLDFHEDEAGPFADFRADAGWERFAVNSQVECEAFLRANGAV